MIEIKDLTKFHLAHDAKVLIQTRNFEKHFLFVEALYSRRRKGKDVIYKNYYMMWGTSFNENEMGVTLLLSKSGRNIKYQAAVNLYFNAIQESVHLEFIK